MLDKAKHPIVSQYWDKIFPRGKKEERNDWQVHLTKTDC